MSSVKSSKEIEIMTIGGKKLAAILRELVSKVAVGVTPMDLEKLAQKRITESGGTPSFMTVNDYAWATCISVNEGVVHGIPTEPPFKLGDLVSIDVGLLYKGYHTDTSWSVLVGGPGFTQDPKVVAFLEAGKEALSNALKQAKAGNRIGQISESIQETIESHGYHVVKNLVGHAIGKKLHEHPQVPGILTKPIVQTPLLIENMTLAIEVIYSMGSAEIANANSDGWTLKTADDSLAGLFEQTVVIGPKEPVVLTESPN